VLSGVIRNSLNGSGVLVNHGGLRRLGKMMAESGSESKEIRRIFEAEQWMKESPKAKD
jgi:hypothetical protein